MRKTIEIKDNLHSLIDKIDNDELLEFFYELLESKSKGKEGDLVKKLSSDQKRELYESYEDSLNDDNLIDLDQLSKKHSKWSEK